MEKNPYVTKPLDKRILYYNAMTKQTMMYGSSVHLLII